MRSSEWLANCLLREAANRGELLTPLKLQKLMFYADAWHMALFGNEIVDEQFEAWVHGPVAVSQFRRFKDYQWRPIDAAIDKMEMTKDEKLFLADILNEFGGESAIALEKMTHSELPWIEARGGLPPDEPCNNKISKETTKVFYASL